MCGDMVDTFGQSNCLESDHAVEPARHHETAPGVRRTRYASERALCRFVRTLRFAPPDRIKIAQSLKKGRPRGPRRSRPPAVALAIDPPARARAARARRAHAQPRLG